MTPADRLDQMADGVEYLATQRDSTSAALVHCGSSGMASNFKASAEELRVKAHALRLGAAALRESEWLDIAGAPKDGSEVDVWTSEGRETDAVYKDGCWRVWGMGGFDQMGYVRMAYQPTHYRPLPSPPKEQEND